MWRLRLESETKEEREREKEDEGPPAAAAAAAAIFTSLAAAITAFNLEPLLCFTAHHVRSFFYFLLFGGIWVGRKERRGGKLDYASRGWSDWVPQI
jgi:hypothetical protein